MATRCILAYFLECLPIAAPFSRLYLIVILHIILLETLLLKWLETPVYFYHLFSASYLAAKLLCA
jgi:hypothetical protein